jgi:transcriptional regulator NrdR family protein
MKPTGLHCPACGKDQHIVLETRRRIGEVRRRRKCFKCGHRFWTVEIIEPARLPVEEK